MSDKNGEHEKILVLVEREGPSLAPITFELLGIGRSIAADLNGTLCAVILGHDVAEISGQIAHFADEVYCLDHPLLENYSADFYASALEQLCQAVRPNAVMMVGTLDNLALAPKLAYKMGVEVITDCVQLSVEPETNHLLCTKPVYGAKILSTFRLDRQPYVVTIRPRSGEPVKADPVKGRVVPFLPVLEPSVAKVDIIQRVREEIVDLSKAEAIVAGGRGIKDVEGLEKLRQLIETLRWYFKSVELGATRPLVDARLVPSWRQIGLTGEKVAPELYIAVGISGSMQHLTGIGGAKKIIAINTSPKAYIFEAADYGVVAGFEEVLPALRSKLEELQ